ncbi:MAG: hypothetical protein JHC93_06955 [Parachlamydiales bacterium]|nr:hypothetical protein [Parachlamydiales bacterium]
MNIHEIHNNEEPEEFVTHNTSVNSGAHDNHIGLLSNVSHLQKNNPEAEESKSPLNLKATIISNLALARIALSNLAASAKSGAFKAVAYLGEATSQAFEKFKVDYARTKEQMNEKIHQKHNTFVHEEVGTIFENVIGSSTAVSLLSLLALAGAAATPSHHVIPHLIVLLQSLSEKLQNLFIPFNGATQILDFVHKPVQAIVMIAGPIAGIFSTVVMTLTSIRSTITIINTYGALKSMQDELDYLNSLGNTPERNEKLRDWMINLRDFRRPKDLELLKRAEARKDEVEIARIGREHEIYMKSIYTPAGWLKFKNAMQIMGLYDKNFKPVNIYGASSANDAHQINEAYLTGSYIANHGISAMNEISLEMKKQIVALTLDTLGNAFLIASVVLTFAFPALLPLTMTLWAIGFVLTKTPTLFETAVTTIEAQFDKRGWKHLHVGSITENIVRLAERFKNELRDKKHDENGESTFIKGQLIRQQIIDSYSMKEIAKPHNILKSA